MKAESVASWNNLTYEEKNHALYEKQKRMLEEFLERGAISKDQFEKSLHDLTEKMETFRNNNERSAGEV